MSKTMAPSQLEDATHHDGSQGRSRIPGCSKPKGPKAWSMTRSMIAAFNSMRGSGNIADSNLVRWANKSQRGDDNELLGDLDHLLAHEAASAEERIPNAEAAGREKRFAILRPAYEHLNPLASSASCKLYQGSDNTLAGKPQRIAEAAKHHTHQGRGGSLRSLEEQPEDVFEPECLSEQYEVSDGEGEPEDGRISPCTFRLWATEVSDGQRRAEEANVNPRPYVHAQSARSTSPGSEGEEAEDFCPPLDPWAAFRIALWQYQVEVTNGRRECPGRRQSGAEGQELDSDDDDLLDGPGQVVCLSDEAIRAALARHDAPTHFDGVPTDAIDEELRLRYQRAKDATYSVTRAVQEKWAAQERIALRSAQVQSVATAIGVIQQQQAQQQARQRERRQRRRRREEIYRHVEEHLRDVAAKADEAEYHASRHWAELDHLLAMEDHVCATLQQMALTVGLDDAVDPDEIEARVVEMGQQAEADAVADMSGDEEDWM
ncbi:hypothetical protein HRG_002416 [Hirsutella rhossiliensis]